LFAALAFHLKIRRPTVTHRAVDPVAPLFDKQGGRASAAPNSPRGQSGLTPLRRWALTFTLADHASAADPTGADELLPMDYLMARKFDNHHSPESDAAAADRARAQPLTRRSFIKGAGAAAAVAGLIGVHAPSAAADDAPAAALGGGVAEKLGPGPVTFDLQINSATRRLTLEPRTTLLGALRDHLGLTGAKIVCDRGACGACTVMIDGAAVTSCMVLAVDARGRRITTIEGLGTPAAMHPLQRAFAEQDALQCGFCTPGMVMALAAAMRTNPAPTIDDVRQAVVGNICRCGTYPHVFKAALAAARTAGTKPPGVV
jgi:xanthine dehydrogenase YagT iron-sulfur-binding subunit